MSVAHHNLTKWCGIAHWQTVLSRPYSMHVACMLWSALLLAAAWLFAYSPSPACTYTRWCNAVGVPEITAELRELQILQYIISHQALWLPAPSQRPPANMTRFERLVIPGGRHHLEGLWKGTYGGHGLEIVTIELSEDGKMLLGRKVGSFTHVSPCSQRVVPSSPCVVPPHVSSVCHSLFSMCIFCMPFFVLYSLHVYLLSAILCSPCVVPS